MINIRKANFTDAYSLYACNRALLPIYYSLDEYLYFIMFSSYKEVLIAEESNNICGYILGEHNGEYMHVLSFGVYPEYRRKGVGRKLMDEIVKLAKTNNDIESISLNVHVENIVGITFYESYGFKRVETLPNYYRGSLNSESQDAYRLEYTFKKDDKSGD